MRASRMRTRRAKTVPPGPAMGPSMVRAAKKMEEVAKRRVRPCANLPLGGHPTPNRLRSQMHFLRGWLIFILWDLKFGVLSVESGWSEDSWWILDVFFCRRSSIFAVFHLKHRIHCPTALRGPGILILSVTSTKSHSYSHVMERQSFSGYCARLNQGSREMSIRSMKVKVKKYLPDFFTETAVTPERKVEKWFPRWEINRHAEG